MSDLFWLTDEQMARLQPYFPRATRGLGLSGAVSLGSVLPDTASGMMSGPRRTRSSGKETTIGAQRNENGEKWCPFVREPHQAGRPERHLQLSTGQG